MTDLIKIINDINNRYNLELILETNKYLHAQRVRMKFRITRTFCCKKIKSAWMTKYELINFLNTFES